ncbi:MAG: zinc ABC transporter substrate-binding protein [Dehalococcoidia bacterium]|nr:MAG: zinc ABC transporter substrate-binding protein [Dehalococcoidia bacterium]
MTATKSITGSLITFVVITIIATAVLTISCTSGKEANGRIGIVVTIPPQAEFVRQIGGENVNVTIMVPSGASPHTYSPTSRQMTDVANAEMYAKVGSEIAFELAWLDKIIAQNRDMLIVDCSVGIILQENAGDHDHQDDGAEQSELEPHIWVSPLNAIRMVRNIYDGLIQIDPDSKAYFEGNMNPYINELEDLDRDIRDSIPDEGDRLFMVYHPSLGYFAREYDLTMLSIEEEGKEPTAAGLTDLIQQAEDHNIKTIFTSPQFNQQSAEAIARQIGAKVVIFDPLAEEYIMNMRSFVNELALALQ